MNDLDLRAIVRDELAGVRMEVPADAVLARGRAIRTRHRSVRAGAAAVFAVAAVAGGLAFAAPGRPSAQASGQPGTRPAVGQGASTQPRATTPATLTAWTVTRSGHWLRVTIRQLTDLPGLQATLRADGARVVVTGSLAWPASCSDWRGGDYRLGNVVRMRKVTGLPSRDGSEFYLNPAEIPAGALLFIGQSPVGKPSGLTGPPGPMTVGYLTDTPACFGG